MSLFKTDGDRHELFGHIGTGILLAVCLMGKLPEHLTAIAFTSSFISTLYLSPDVDLASSQWMSKSLHRWKRLGLLWIWKAFQAVPGSHHRGITHTPIIGAIVVMGWVGFWLGSPLVFGIGFLVNAGVISADTLKLDYLVIGALVSPVIMQQLIHLALDGEIL